MGDNFDSIYKKKLIENYDKVILENITDYEKRIINLDKDDYIINSFKLSALKNKIFYYYNIVLFIYTVDNYDIDKIKNEFNKYSNNILNNIKNAYKNINIFDDKIEYKYQEILKDTNGFKEKYIYKFFDKLENYEIITIPQYKGTCWFNSILTGLCYSDNMKKLILSKIDGDNIKFHIIWYIYTIINDYSNKPLIHIFDDKSNIIEIYNFFSKYRSFYILDLMKTQSDDILDRSLKFINKNKNGNYGLNQLSSCIFLINIFNILNISCYIFSNNSLMYDEKDSKLNYHTLYNLYDYDKNLKPNIIILFLLDFQCKDDKTDISLNIFKENNEIKLIYNNNIYILTFLLIDSNRGVCEIKGKCNHCISAITYKNINCIYDSSASDKTDDDINIPSCKFQEINWKKELLNNFNFKIDDLNCKIINDNDNDNNLYSFDTNIKCVFVLENKDESDNISNFNIIKKFKSKDEKYKTINPHELEDFEPSAPPLEKEDYAPSAPSAPPLGGGNKYKSLGYKINIIYNKKKLSRTIYENNRKTKFVKINNNYILLSKIKNMNK